MEILQTIWTALTTENEVVLHFIEIPFVYIEATLTILLSMILLSLNISKKKIILFILIIPTVSNITNFIASEPVKVVINLISIPLLSVFLFKLNFFKGLLIEFLPMIFMLITQTIFVNFSNIVFNISADQINSIPLYRIIMACLNYLCLFLIIILANKYKFNIKLFDGINKNTKRILTINSFIGVLAIFTQLYLLGFYSSKLPYFITIIGLLSLLAYFFISMYSLANTSKLAIANTNLEQEKETNKRLKEFQDELHSFRHDFSNIMCTISGYIQVNDMDGLKQYYSEIQKDINKVNTLGSLSPDIINNPAIFILISSKYSKALEENIEMNINIFLDLNTLNMKIYEFTRILGILLDNSIEAAKECNEKVINIEIRKDTNRNRQLLIIENTYNDKNIDTEKIFEKKYSTKDGNSGLGLWEVRQILKRNNNLNLFTSKTDKYFKQQLEMYN